MGRMEASHTYSSSSWIFEWKLQILEDEGGRGKDIEVFMWKITVNS